MQGCEALYTNSEIGLEGKSQDKLDLARGGGGAMKPSRAGIEAARRTREDQVGTPDNAIKTCMIQQIEKFRSKLKPPLGIQGKFPL